MKPIRSRKNAISNVEKDFEKPTKITAWERASRDWKRTVSKAKSGAENWSKLYRDWPRGFDAHGLPIPVEPTLRLSYWARRLGSKRAAKFGD